jgi:hypothetical protein
MATFVLIHGAGDVGWYWHLVEAELRERGHDVAVLGEVVQDGQHQSRREQSQSHRPHDPRRASADGAHADPPTAAAMASVSTREPLLRA